MLRQLQRLNKVKQKKKFEVLSLIPFSSQQSSNFKLKTKSNFSTENINNMVEKTINCSKVGMTHVIGKGGSTIKKLKEETGAKFDTEVKGDLAVITVTAEDDASLTAAVKKVEAILKEQENPDYEGPEGSALREKASAHGKERDRLMAAAQEKFDGGDKSAGHELMAKRKEEDELMRKTNEEAAKAILKFNNDGHGDAYLDLHGLRTQEAEEFVKERLEELEKKAEGTNLTLIPGAGHHSAPGKVALKPMVEEMLTKKGIEWSEIDAGSICAKIKGTDGKLAPEGTGGSIKDSTTASADETPETAPEKPVETTEDKVESTVDSTVKEVKEQVNKAAEIVKDKLEDVQDKAEDIAEDLAAKIKKKKKKCSIM